MVVSLRRGLRPRSLGAVVAFVGAIVTAFRGRRYGEGSSSEVIACWCQNRRRAAVERQRHINQSRRARNLRRNVSGQSSCHVFAAIVGSGCCGIIRFGYRDGVPTDLPKLRYAVSLPHQGRSSSKELPASFVCSSAFSFIQLLLSFQLQLSSL